MTGLRAKDRLRIAVLAVAVIAGTIAAGSMPARAVDYADGRPLGQLIREDSRACRAMDSLSVPVITWGADMVTIHAAGDDGKTRDGSLFDRAGLDISLTREDDFTEQVRAYMRCDTPFLRATLGMASLAADVTEAKAESRMVAIYQHSWSAGGDAMVVKPGITKPEDLAGKTIALQQAGPHVDYLARILRDAGLSLNDVTLKWTTDLVGPAGSTPAAALLEDDAVDAAMVILPDALALTSSGVGTGAENSVKGARTLLSTKTANRIIADLYFVRADYLEANREQVQAFVSALLKAEEETRAILKAGGQAKAELLTATARILLDDSGAVADAEALWGDAETVGWSGQGTFFTDPSYPRRYDTLVTEVQDSFAGLGLVAERHALGWAGWPMEALAEGLSNTGGVEQARFNEKEAAQVVTRRQAQGTMDDATLFAFEVNFRPNQQTFDRTAYGEAFSRVAELATTYGGAVITVEGHADPLGYLRAKKKGEGDLVLNRIVQSARNLSVSRAQSVRDAVIAAAEANGIWLDRSQFVTVGRGLEDPKTGICGPDPCAPQTEEEWYSNMRVVFRIVNVEAEANAFVPLD